MKKVLIATPCLDQKVDAYFVHSLCESIKLGLMTAIIEFMTINPHWVFHIHKTNNNGLTVLKRI